MGHEVFYNEFSKVNLAKMTETGKSCFIEVDLESQHLSTVKYGQMIKMIASLMSIFRKVVFMLGKSTKWYVSISRCRQKWASHLKWCGNSELKQTLFVEKINF